ncbi:cartilage oligomeric matrix protein-like [Malaya genurostris]|uniref:cartilage oligomeric matrix protein-like n=1 Tax=Malaya genurostris TaxID=325434 RepID=UPI0026F3A549|nr:cartilage oligomeric matrix protein-like [Malaya genurostris]
MDRLRFLLTVLILIPTGEVNPTPVCYGDARDHYLQPGKNHHQQTEHSPFPPDKCRLAKEMEQEIHVLRTLMDKCDRCLAETTTLTGEGGDGRRRCSEGPCFGQTPCIETSDGKTVCGPCPVGFDGNGTHCHARTGSTGHC